MPQLTQRLIQAVAPRTIVRAHCDIPCGIYDPAGAVLAAQTVAKMVDLIAQRHTTLRVRRLFAKVDCDVGLRCRAARGGTSGRRCPMPSSVRLYVRGRE